MSRLDLHRERLQRDPRYWQPEPIDPNDTIGLRELGDFTPPVPGEEPDPQPQPKRTQRDPTPEHLDAAQQLAAWLREETA